MLQEGERESQRNFCCQNDMVMMRATNLDERNIFNSNQLYTTKKIDLASYSIHGGKVTKYIHIILVKIFITKEKSEFKPTVLYIKLTFVSRSFHGEVIGVNWYSVRVFAMVLETGVQSLGRVIPKTQKWYLMLPCLALSIIRNGSKVSGAIQGNEWCLPLHLSCSNCLKWTLRVTLVYGRPSYLYTEWVKIIWHFCRFIKSKLE